MHNSNEIAAEESLFLSIRLAVVNFSPAIKRLFWWQPQLYFAFSIAALLASIRWSFNRNRLIVAALVFLWVGVTTSLDRSLYLYAPLLFIWIFSPSLPYQAVERAFWSLRYFFLVSVAYAVFQKTSGYLPHELGWIYSGVGAVREEGYFVTEEIRAFSFYAGIPEFGFFSAIYLYFAIQKRRIDFFIVALLGIYLAGSRGAMVSTMIALAALFLYKSESPKKAVYSGLIIAILCYLALVFLIPIFGFFEAKDDSSRLLIYGTFGFRVSMLLELLAEVNFTNVWFGIHTDREIFDNLYLTLLNDFGIGGVLVLLVGLLHKVNTKCNMFFAVFVLSYCMYADALFSVYFSYNAFLLLNSNAFLSDESPTGT